MLSEFRFSKQKLSHLVYGIGVILLSSTFILEAGAVQCRSYGRQLGECVLITRCPRLLAILLSADRTNQDLRMLQKLTCITEISDLERDPVVCCPLNEISDALTSNSNIPDSSETESQEYRNGTTTTPLPSKVPQQSAPTFQPNKIQAQQSAMKAYEALIKTKFPLMPALKDCSLSVVTNRIIGGQNVSHGTYPWMARLGYRHKGTGKLEYYCGGTIISKRYVLTAGHCTQGFDDNFVLSEVQLGEHDTAINPDCNEDLGNVCSSPENFRIEKIITHPEHNTGTKQNDIALLRLNRDISFDSYFIRPVCLPFLKEYELDIPKASEFESQNAWVAGWGRQLWNKTQGSQQLLHVSIPIVPNARCQQKYHRRVILTPKQMCAGGVASKDSCSGDSGGPLMATVQIPSKFSKNFQFGIVSFGQIQCGGSLPGVYTRVSEYLPWILQSIQPS